MEEVPKAAAAVIAKSKQDLVDTTVVSPSAEEEYKVLTDTSLPRVKAAFVVLVRNKELYALRSSMRYLEDRFNHKYHYPWIFLNEEPFTEEFINMTQMMTTAKVHYGLVPKEHWSYPDWIDQDYAKQCREDMAEQKIVYGGSESYRHMCRYQSGFFMLHPLLDNLDYYWRVEPGVKFSCDIDYDPFRLMQERDLKYGFTIALREYRATIPTLWRTTIDFAKSHPQYIYPRTRPDSLLRFVSDDNGWSYNLCHFWSNFEIASVKYMRSEGYQAYFKYLDQQGGFFYERWGDAPVHSIAVALMLKESDVHWFYDIGYKHDNFEHCPTEEKWLLNSKCYCDAETSFDFNQGSCSSLYLDVANRTASSYIVTQPDKDD
ncbi:nucleotide-diphospho-sugar transferase [Gilbertella persicaria]|uniref:nucleotide-diphospho-sugar transferase n=1 Tax=Gilbertella persicaria TaxID=101096 RepID=UPI0022203C29|nr:nucleotide-diphospho-sugar transferase [Gilbertella persicaria]KAI8090077.1 nucleotide-diphospho-sugar transferase [Gilbertella persicaria]